VFYNKLHFKIFLFPGEKCLVRRSLGPQSPRRQRGGDGVREGTALFRERFLKRLIFQEVLYHRSAWTGREKMIKQSPE
jgi:hypothetical protein